MNKKLLLFVTITLCSLCEVFGQYYQVYYVPKKRKAHYYKEYVIRESSNSRQPIVIVNNNNNNVVRREYSDVNCYEDDNYVVKNDEVRLNRNEILDDVQHVDMWRQTIHFGLNRYRLDTSDRVTIENIVDYLEDHPNVRIELRGYSSRERGGWDDNFLLAKKRLKSVFEALIQCNIDEDRIELVVEGIRNHIYDVDNWNQCVVIKAIE